MRLACIVGARPNFMKIAPILRQLDQRSNVEATLIHTGQHYDASLSDVFFQELGIRRPDLSLEVGSDTHARQTADIIVAIERSILHAAEQSRPFDRLLVVGDVNSTMAATLAAAKLQLPVAHVEAGLRSRDRSMPEEVNRIVTDSLSDMLFCSEPEGMANLKLEGHQDAAMHLVGNVMIDTLFAQMDKARGMTTLEECQVTPGDYAVVTLHRPSNVDDCKALSNLVGVLRDTSRRLPMVFPVHPRTRKQLESFGLMEKLEDEPNVRLTGPLGYHDFLCLTSQAKVVVTDSGGLQDESTALGVPCLTLRRNTERPITVTEGTSTLIGSCADKLAKYLDEVIGGEYKPGRCPDLWDGKAAERIVEVLVNSTGTHYDQPHRLSVVE